MNSPCIYLVDHDSRFRAACAYALTARNYHVEIYENAAEFLRAPAREGLLLLDAQLPDMPAIPLVERLAAVGCDLPVILLSQSVDLAVAVQATKLGVYDFVLKPLEYDSLERKIATAWVEHLGNRTRLRRAVLARAHLDDLTRREREVLDRLAGGNSNKQIARALEISPRTVELHRAHVMRKLGAGHISDVLRIYFDGALVPTA